MSIFFHLPAKERMEEEIEEMEEEKKKKKDNAPCLSLAEERIKKEKEEGLLNED